MYTSANSATLDMTVAGSPDPFSMVCLSCHDGVTALDAMVSNNGYGSVSAGSNNLVTWGSVDADLTDDHPISIEYDIAKDGDFFDDGNDGDIGGLPLFAGLAAGTGTVGDADQVECATCHDVHDQDTYFPFLRMSNAASALCLTCHDK
jgi:predicted CXXCH cytochrome family protein